MVKIILLIVIKVIETIISAPFQNLLVQIRELNHQIRLALKPDADGRIRVTPEEIQIILKEADDVLDAAEEVAKLIAQRA